MKKMLLVTILLLPFLLKAQKYVPFPTKNTVWSEYYFSIYSYPANVYHYFALKDNDTIINGLQYHKLYCSFDTVFTEDELCGGLREENKREYYYSLKYLDEKILDAPIPADTEVILYDFNLQPGDTITSDLFRLRVLNETLVINIDSILIGDQYWKRYNFGYYFGNNSYTWEDPWVEGVGNLSGLLSDIGPRPTSDWNSWLICMIEDGESLYHDSQFGSCYYSNTNSVQILENNSEIKIAPNPAGSSLNVDFGNNHYQKMVLSDLSGKPIRQYLVEGLETFTLERDGLSGGIYFLSVFDKAGNTRTMKVLFDL